MPKCQKTIYRRIEGYENFFKKERIVTDCKPKIKKRCDGGVLASEDPKTNRKKGDPCKDDLRFSEY